jgi:hypothetical protein
MSSRASRSSSESIATLLSDLKLARGFLLRLVNLTGASSEEELSDNMTVPFLLTTVAEDCAATVSSGIFAFVLVLFRWMVMSLSDQSSSDVVKRCLPEWAFSHFISLS